MLHASWVGYTTNFPEKITKTLTVWLWCRRVEIWCLIFNLLYGTNSVTTIDWETFLPYCSHKLITQYIQLRSSQPAFISANYFWRWLYNKQYGQFEMDVTDDESSDSRPCLVSRVVSWCIKHSNKRNMMTNHWTDCLYFKVQIFNSFILWEFHHVET